MSSLSGAHYEADLPIQSSDPAGGRDAELLRKAQRGDRGAFGQIVVLYQDRLYNALLRVIGDPEEARELTQETFTRALVKIDSFRGEAGPYTWLFRIGVNLAISQLRKIQRHRTFSLDRPSGAANGADSDDQASSLLDRVAQNVRSEEARELTQETFTRALVKIDSFRGEAGPYTWLFRIGVNLAISQLRKIQRHRTFSLDRPSGAANGADSDDQASSLLDRVAQNV